MTSPPPASEPPLHAYVEAARRGERARAWRAGAAVVLAPAAPAGAVEVPVLPLFGAALAAVFGADIAAAALRDLEPGDGALDAAAVLQAVGHAESLGTIGDARHQIRRMQFSALLLGHRFTAVCDELGVDPHALPAQRRQAIDDAVGWHPGLTSADAARQIRDLLRTALH